MTLTMTPVIVNNTGAGNETVAASGVTTLATASAIDGTAMVALGIYAQVTYHANATAGATAYVYASANGTNYGSTGGLQIVDFPFAAGTTKALAFTVLPGHKYYKVLVKNNDTAQSMTALYVYAEPQVLS